MVASRGLQLSNCIDGTNTGILNTYIMMMIGVSLRMVEQYLTFFRTVSSWVDFPIQL